MLKNKNKKNKNEIAYNKQVLIAYDKKFLIEGKKSRSKNRNVILKTNH